MDFSGIIVRVINILFSLDCFLFSLVTLGKAYPYESFSSAAHRANKLGKVYGIMEPLIDYIFLKLFNQSEHCKKAYIRAKENLPEDMR